MHLCVQCIHSRISHQPCNPIQMPCSRLTRFADQCTFVWIRIRIFIMKEMSPVPLGHYKTKIIEKSKIFVVVRLYSTSNFLLFFYLSRSGWDSSAWDSGLVWSPRSSSSSSEPCSLYSSEKVSFTKCCTVCESAYTILCTPNALRYVQYIEYCLTIVHNWENPRNNFSLFKTKEKKMVQLPTTPNHWEALWSSSSITS